MANKKPQFKLYGISKLSVFLSLWIIWRLNQKLFANGEFYVFMKKIIKVIFVLINVQYGKRTTVLN